jgi:hypothetical protein
MYGYGMDRNTQQVALQTANRKRRPKSGLRS